MKHGAVLITGGAGFVGSNLAHALLTDGWPVVLLDNFSRAGVEYNAEWLRETHGDLVNVVTGDVRDSESVSEALCRAEAAGGGKVAGVFHFAAQVAVTSSLQDPMHDYLVNVGGTITLLEALRGLRHPPPLVSTSTNKVYGELRGLETRRAGDRYVPLDPVVAGFGVDEGWPLDFRSPYGCSKGAADQYVLEYARSFGVPAAVFRMSCIYG
ncbi:MAG TPA: SDR family NAD(P)-dependent oxidoreductase, partial [Chloroflexota bacterium]|nr:SDR family NAD(P)-dependent oxidoreductase [Chloroflexota bacterium]